MCAEIENIAESKKNCHFFVQQIMNEWQQNTQQKVLVISLTPIGGLWPILRFPLCGRGKHCYFVKKNDEPINLKDIKSVGITII